VAAVLSLAPVGGLAACLAAHILLSRAGIWSRPRALVASGLAGMVAVAAVGGAFLVAGPSDVATADRIGAALVWTIAYLALVYAYVFGFFNVGESARRVRLLIELDEVGGQGLTRDELFARYNAGMIVDARLERMIAGGQIEVRAGRYVIRRRAMLVIAKAFVLLKLAFLGAPTEFGAQRLVPGSSRAPARR
jgi:hypothetical protein